jgi:peptide/nickel transport system substrate-binding protein
MTKDTFVVLQPTLPLGDPHICSDGKDRVSLISAVYEALISRDGPGVYSPCLAESWRCDGEARVWDFRLRRGVQFHDSRELGADDATASLERVRSPKVGGAWGTQGVYASYLNGAEFEAVDKGRVRITLTEPMADLLDLLAEMPIVPEEDLDELPEEHVGSGLYKVDDFDEEKVVMTAHARHWRGKPHHNRLLWRAEPEEPDRLKLVGSSEADIASGITPEGKKSSDSSRIGLVSRYGSMCVIYMMNCSQGPCRDVRVRRALNLALNRGDIVEKIMLGAAEQLTGHLTPLHLGWDPDTPGYAYDPDEAKRLMAEAGHRGGLTIRMDAPTESPDEALPLSRLIAEQYREVGVETELRVHRDRPGYAEMVRAKRIGDLCCFDSSPLSTFRVMREKIHSGLRGPWWEGYTSREVDALIDSAQRSPEREERQRAYRRAYGAISSDAPWVFLYRPEYSWALKPGGDWAPSWDCVIRVS